MALVGVGFMTIFREGFETTMFMQSLILEAGMPSVLIGLGTGAGLIAAMGFTVFLIGAKLSYPRMLIFYRRISHFRALHLRRLNGAALSKPWAG